jgi:hypothetical protein
MKKWEIVSMDFVFDLPVTSSGKSGIAVIVDKLSQQAHFVVTRPFAPFLPLLSTPVA